MSHKSVTISLGAIFAMVIGTILFFHQQYVAPNNTASAQQYDSFAYDIEQTHFTKTGSVDHVFVAPAAKHYTQQDYVLITQPHVVMHNKEGDWIVSADTGKSIDNNSELQLEGHVHITQPATAHTPATEMITTSAIIFPKRAYAQTDAMVVIERGGTEIEGKGAVANMKTGMIKLLSQTRGHYAPTSVHS